MLVKADKDKQVLTSDWTKERTLSFAENPPGYKVTLEASGLKKEDIIINMDDSTLTIQAEKEEEKEEKKTADFNC